MGNRLGIRTILVALLIASLAGLASCRSISSGETSAFEYDYTLHLVKDQTQEQAITELFMTLNTYSQTFIPSQYSFLETSRAQIPGMDTLISRWTRQVTDFLIANYDSFTVLSTDMANAIEFTDPIDMVRTSDSSITELYSETFYQTIERSVMEKLQELDLSTWERIVIQYNAWVATQTLLGRSDLYPIGESNIVSNVATLAADLYFAYFSQQETLIRTTPDPDMDSTAARVLGLD